MINITALQWALFTGIALSVIILFVIIYLFIERYRQQKRKAAIEQYYNKYLSAWHEFLVLGKDDVSLVRSHRKDEHTFWAIDHIFSNYVTNINDTDVINRISHYASVHFKKHYQNMLHDRNWSIRLNALYRVLHYNLNFLTDDIRKMLQKKQFKNIDDYSLMLKIMAKHDEALVISHLLKPRIPFKEYEYKHIIFYLPKSFYPKLIEHFDEMPLPLQTSLLEYFSFKQSIEQNYLTFFEKQLQSENAEIRLRALKAIQKFGHITDISIYEPFKNSSLWEERMIFTRLVINGDLQYAINALKELISDSSWWVRKSAARSLFHVKNGPSILHEIAQHHPDPFAVQAAKEILKVE